MASSIEALLSPDEQHQRKYNEHSGQNPDSPTDQQFGAVANSVCSASFPIFTLFKHGTDPDDNSVMCPSCAGLLEPEELRYSTIPQKQSSGARALHRPLHYLRTKIHCGLVFVLLVLKT